MEHYLHRVELLRDEVPDFGIYPFCLDAVRELTALELHPKVSWREWLGQIDALGSHCRGVGV